MSLGENLRVLRNDKGWTQEELSKRTGIKVGHISKLERDESDPKLSTLEKLISALECSADSLVFNQEKSATSQLLRFYLTKAMELPKEEKEAVIMILQKFTVAENIRKINNGVTMPDEYWEIKAEEKEREDEYLQYLAEKKALEEEQ